MDPKTTVSRREFVRFGCLATPLLTVPAILQARATHAAAAGTSPDETAVILVSLGGGASQFETWDPKPEAPAEYRGTRSPIATAVPGMSFCELMPQLAQVADRTSIVRSVHHRQASHIALHIVETGYDLTDSAKARPGEMPSVGSIVSRMRSGSASELPRFVSLPKPHAYSGPQWVGAEHNFFAVNSDPSSDDFQVKNLTLLPGMDRPRLQARRELRQQVSGQRSLNDLAGQAASIDRFTEQAFDLVTGDRAERAFDLTRETDATRDRYGRTTFGQRALLSRRLVEAGVPFVALRTFDWDDHKELDRRMGQRCPTFDQGLAALIADLAERGLSRRVLVLAMGEFGRTPRVNGSGGRDHWPKVMSVLFAGGEFRMGQVIGGTDSLGSEPVAAPYSPQSVLTMAYRHLGIDPGTAFPDYSGRPRYILEDRQPIAELL